MQMTSRLISAGTAVLSAALLTGCMREVNLNPRSEEGSVESLPMSTKIEVSESLSKGMSGSTIAFDLKKAAVGYFKNRGTFREVVDGGGSDTVLKIASRFSFSSEMSFHYDFELNATLQGGGKLLGTYHVQCSAAGGQIRLSNDADRIPMNKALTQCLDSLAGQIEANGPTLLAKMHGALREPSAPERAAAAPSFQGSSDVDRPTYQRPENPDDFALVIGIDRYESLPPADFAERDADAVRRHLLALGYPERNIIYLTGPKASRTGIEKYVETWLPLNVKENSRLFVYFSGHGAPDTRDGQAYLVPWDGDAQFLKNTGYPLKRLYAGLNALKAKRIMVAMDACFTGEGGRSVLAKGARPLVSKVDVGTEGSGKLVVLAAAAADEITATDAGQGHGLFTYFFLKGLEAKKGQGSAQDLFDYLKPQVQDGARREGREQTPQLLGAQAGTYSL